MTLAAPISVCQARMSHWRIASPLRRWLVGLTPRGVRESEPGDCREDARRGERPRGTRSWRQYPWVVHREEPWASRRPGLGDNNSQRSACDVLPVHATHPPVDPWKSGGTGRIPARLSSKASPRRMRSEEHTSELQSHSDLVCRLLLEKKKPSHHSGCTCKRLRP